MVCEILKKGVGPVLLLLLISACGEIGGSGQCGGGEETGSCVRIESITPKYDEKSTFSVDVFRGICSGGTASSTEILTDHIAELIISNRPIPPLKKEDISDVTIQSYSISYTLNTNCALIGAICPGLRPVVGLLETFRVPADGTVTVTLSFFDLLSKAEYRSATGSLSAFPRYTANYRLTGTDSHKNPISVEGSTEFQIGDFLNACQS